MGSEAYPVTSSAMELNASTDKLMATIDRIKKAFAAYRFGVEAAVIPKDDAAISGIAYEKFHGEWEITVDAEGSVDAITNIRRDLRLAAIKYLPQLFEEMKRNAAKMREQIEAVLPQVTELAEELERGLEG